MKVKEILDYKLVVQMNRDVFTFILKYKIKNRQIYDEYIRDNYDEKIKTNRKIITICSVTHPEIRIDCICLPGCHSSYDEIKEMNYFYLIDYESSYLLFAFRDLCKAMETFMNKDINKLIFERRKDTSVRYG